MEEPLHFDSYLRCTSDVFAAAACAAVNPFFIFFGLNSGDEALQNTFLFY
jgi:hypothetical protein